MKKYNGSQRLTPFTAVLLPISLACTVLLSSCATTNTTSTISVDGSGFKFWVLRYQPPVDAASWVPDAALSADPEGAALNIASAMQKGKLDQWLSNWQAAERPNLSAAESQALLQQWQLLQRSHFAILGRVVAEAEVIVELSVVDANQKQEKLQIPLKREHDRWWLTAMDPTSEYLHWENSPNKLIQYIDPDAFQKHLKLIEGAKQKAEIKPRPATPSIAGL